MVSDENGCSARDSVYVFSVTHVDDLQIFPEIIKIYPNPAKDFFNVVMEMDKPGHVIFELYNFLNTLVHREDFRQIQTVDKRMDVQGMPSGIYFLRITIDDVQHTYKVIVE